MLINYMFQKHIIQRLTKSAIHPNEQPTIRFNTVHIDIISPLPFTSGCYETYNTSYRYVLICIDCSTKWIEAEMLTDITAQSVTNSFVHVWITRWAVSLHVITYHCTQLILFSDILNSWLLQITHDQLPFVNERNVLRYTQYD